MSDEHAVSRRASLKSLGAIGAVAVLGGVAAAQSPAESKPAGGPDKPASNAIDVAVDRFTKGHA